MFDDFIEQWRQIGISCAVAHLMRREMKDPRMCRGGLADVIQRGNRLQRIKQLMEVRRAR